uniref:DUF3310 domain-containing protein n=1 Tax=Succinivibrio sp. TaxID=2053619 RepID=UPI00402A75F1
MTDTIFNPKHYMQGSHECIDEIKAMLTPDEFKGFLKGNIIKYRYRANLKNGKEDLAKADNYAYYLMHGCFKKVKDDDSVSDNSNNDSMPDVLGYIIGSSGKLLSNLEKAEQMLKDLKFIDTYKGKKIENDKDLMAFNLFTNLSKVIPIAELVACMYRQKDLNPNTVATLRCIRGYVDTGSAMTLDNDDNNLGHVLIIFRDKSKLRLDILGFRGCSSPADAFRFDLIKQWQKVRVDKE